MAKTPARLDPRLDRVLLDEEQLRQRVQELAVEICRDFHGSDNLHLVGILTGAFVFMADLARAIHRAGGPLVRCVFVRARAYGIRVGQGAAEPVTVEVDRVPDSVAGCDVIVVEDILDQGHTLTRIRDLLLTRARARSVRLCVLLDKTLEQPSPEVAAVRKELKPDYCGFTVPDRWLAGYGLDAADEFRALPYVAIVREECFGGGGGAGALASGDQGEPDPGRCERLDTDVPDRE